MGPFRVVVEEILIEQILVQRPPESFDLSVGLGTTRARVAVRDSEFLQHPLHRVMRRVPRRGHLGAIVCQDGLEPDAVLRFSMLMLFSAANITLRPSGRPQPLSTRG